MVIILFDWQSKNYNDDDDETKPKQKKRKEHASFFSNLSNH